MMIAEDQQGRAAIASREITIENSTFCGAKCIMCPRDEYHRKWTHMPTDLFCSVVDQAVELGVTSLDLCGFGDTFLDPELGKKLDIVKSKYPELIVYTSTTAHALQGKVLDVVCKHFDTIRISNYGFSKDSYEAVHAGRLKYEKVMQNIENYLSIPADKRPYTMMSFLILLENEHEQEEWLEYWKEKVDEIAIWRPHNYGGSDSVDPMAFRSKEREVGTDAKSCGRPTKGNPFVRTNGDISVCCFDFNEKLVIGNLNQSSLFDILTGEKMKHVQDVHARKAFDGCGLLCDGCDQLYDRNDALVYASNSNRKTGQPNNHPDHIVELTS
jgi:MoaA/NifB/PqqE/SkfB family radical SAM enzyme